MTAALWYTLFIINVILLIGIIYDRFKSRITDPLRALFVFWINCPVAAVMFLIFFIPDKPIVSGEIQMAGLGIVGINVAYSFLVGYMVID